MAVVPTPPTITGGVLTSSQLNQYRDAINFTDNPPRAELRQIVAQTFTTAVAAAFTFTAFDVDQDYLGGAGHSISVNTSRYTANYAGWYQASGAGSFANNTTGTRIMTTRVNGTVLSGSRLIIPAASSGANAMMVPVRTKHVYLNVGDYVEIWGLQDSGSNLNSDVSAAELQASMTVRWVSN
jgi:hypothetical protein